MCLSVKKTFENCRDSMSGLMETRQENKNNNNVDCSQKAFAAVDQNENVEEEVVVVEEKIFISDRLALMTQMTRKFFNECRHVAKSLEKSTFYK